ncbi:hypothetical protein CTEN210_11321 [Chaetoceros tenuissimus]|uniref:Uncharacterized protein n=1 Tax=Chaetoceros tenuissimus TaxID=426638 RepID=A0AAD3H910_9STRA|nr:hypothetical protein CTEN210_11321 [Chaetoceros tenuissimus]
MHWDSHPDLACPNVPALSCFAPRREWVEKNSMNLYEMLDFSEGGIAEWIIPLVLAGSLNRVCWIKNSWCDQFENGHFHYHVGVSTNTDNVESFLDLSEEAVVKSSLAHPYYIDDSTYESQENLQLSQKLDLFVAEDYDSLLSIPSFIQASRNDQEEKKSDWILDICLDYFWCHNPFLDDLKDISFEIYQTFLGIVTSVDFRNESSSAYVMNEDEVKQYSNSLHDFHKQMKNFLDFLNEIDISTSNCLVKDEILERLLEFYTDKEKVESLFLKLLDQVVHHCRSTESNPKELISIMINALPNALLPFTDLSVIEDTKNLNELILEKVEIFGQTLRYKQSFICKSLGLNDVPMLVTIARSAEDGYCPKHVVEYLQEAVIDEIHSIYCHDNCETKCNIRVTKDYGQYEGSTMERAN